MTKIVRFLRRHLLYEHVRYSSDDGRLSVNLPRPRRFWRRLAAAVAAFRSAT